jgi:hypothetical protein
VEEWVLPDDAMPAYDVQCPLPLLPWALKTTPQSIPAAVPYLTADPADAEHWRRRIGLGNGIKIGIAWAGRPAFAQYRMRSVPAAKLAPLGMVTDVRWFSLQKEKSAAKAPLDLIDWTEELEDFADTAGLIANLDLVICGDTAVAHLAGAMGKPVWMLLTFVPDWRWMLDRSDSPWYPTMRLFRQPSLGDWDTPIRQAAEALAELKKT